MGIYRNQTPTMAQIQAMSRIRITTPQEATAFLRTLAPINEQIVYVLQRASLMVQRESNKIDTAMRNAAVKQQTAPVAPEPVTTFEPENLQTEEGFTESDIEEKVAKLKKARKSSK